MVLEVCERKDAPSYSKEDYPYIQRGFIKPHFRLIDGLDTYYRCVTNETTNCYTQLIGLVVFTATWVSLLFETPEHSHDRHALTYLRVMYFGDIVVNSFSLVCHTFQARNEQWHSVLSVMDWGGSVIALVCTMATLDFASPHTVVWIPSFMTKEHHFFLALTCFTLLLVSFVFLTTSHLFRFGSLFVVAVASIVPCIGPVASHHGVTMLTAGAFILGGGLFFGSHIPERYVARHFDLWLSSHTLWHVGYIVGMYIGHSAIYGEVMRGTRLPLERWMLDA